MANARPPWVSALLDTALTPTDYRVFAYLVWRQGENGSAWPGLQRIGNDLGLSKSTVLRSIENLVKRGRVTRRRPERNGRGRTNYYTVKGITHDTYTSDIGSTHDTGKVSPMTPKHNTDNTDSKASDKPTFDASSETFLVSEGRRERWGKAYPAIDVDRELLKAAIWWADNPSKVKHKKDIGRFLGNWMGRAERGFPGKAAKREPQRGDFEWTPTEEELAEIERQEVLA